MTEESREPGGVNVVEEDYCCGEGQSVGGCGGAYTEEDLGQVLDTEKAPGLSQGLLRDEDV